jgi:cyclomaltodextrinase / maltogenic alpha-amylase / neopullulanase
MRRKSLLLALRPSLAPVKLSLTMKIKTRLSRAVHIALVAVFFIASRGIAADRDVSGEHARAVRPWLRESVLYEIYPRSFSPGGDFNGITAQLDQLKDLGVNVLWLMPIHPIGEKLRKGTLGSPYAVRDYYAINSEFGSTNDFRRLVKEAHARGLRVILDIVANHTAWDNVMIGGHPEFYKQDATGKIIPPVPEWTDVAGLNYANPQLRLYMINMLKYWLTEYDVDGFRCDVAHMVPVDFWEQARVELEQVKPDVLMLAEASQPKLLVKAFDLDYSWPLHATLNQVLLEGAPATDLRRSWEESRRQFPQGSLHLCISDNHDEARAVARFGIRGALASQVFMMTLDGVPLLYNGMEAGDATESGDPALFEKLPVFWKPKERPPLRDIYRDLIKLRRQYAPFRNDNLTWLRNSDEANLVTFLRQDDKDEFVVVINFSNRPEAGSVEVANAREFKPLKIAGVPEPRSDSFPHFRLKGFEWRIYHRVVTK